MRELHYGAGVITVGFGVCSAVFDYTVALANAGRSDRITVPVYSDGRLDFSNLLLGPTTQLYCSVGPDDSAAAGLDLDDAELIDDLRQKTRMLANGSPLAPSNHTGTGIDARIDVSDLD